MLTSTKGCNSVVNQCKMTLFNSNKELVNNILYTKSGLNMSIRSEDMEQKPNSDSNQAS